MRAQVWHLEEGARLHAKATQRMEEEKRCAADSGVAREHATERHLRDLGEENKRLITQLDEREKEHEEQRAAAEERAVARAAEALARQRAEWEASRQTYVQRVQQLERELASAQKGSAELERALFKAREDARLEAAASAGRQAADTAVEHGVAESRAQAALEAMRARAEESSKLLEESRTECARLKAELRQYEAAAAASAAVVERSERAMAARRREEEAAVDLDESPPLLDIL